ncbi:hypothetical protein EV714DRAFT_271968 [Schizophyllum commune]
MVQRVLQAAGVMHAVPMSAQYNHPSQQPGAQTPPIARLTAHPPPSVGCSSASSTPPPQTPPASGVQAGPAPSGRTKTSHTTIEHRYRTNLNARILSLRNAVPALRFLEDREPRKPSMTTPVNDVPNTNPVIFDEKGLADGVKPPRKLSKANVLLKATEYILVLKRREKRLSRAQHSLKALLGGLVGGQVLVEEWEREWRRMWGDILDDPSEGIYSEASLIGLGMAEDDEDEDSGDEEAGGKRKRARSTIVVNADGSTSVVVPEKRKRGRPRKNPLPPQVVEAQTAPLKTEPAPTPRASGTQQFLFATFALFSFFNNGPLANYTMPKQQHAHSRVVLTAHPLSATDVPTPTPTWVPSTHEIVQYFHLLVSVLVFVSFFWPAISAFFGRKASVVAQGGDKQVLSAALEQSQRGKEDEAQNIRDALVGASAKGLWDLLTGWLPGHRYDHAKHKKSGKFEQLGLEQRAWVRLGELEVLRGLRDECLRPPLDLRAHAPSPLLLHRHRRRPFDSRPHPLPHRPHHGSPDVSYNAILGVIAVFSAGAIRQFCTFAVVVLVAHWFLAHTFFLTVLSIDIQRLELDELLRQNTSLGPAIPARERPLGHPNSFANKVVFLCRRLLKGRATNNISLFMLLGITATLYYATTPASFVLSSSASPAAPTVSGALTRPRVNITHYEHNANEPPAKQIWKLLNPDEITPFHVVAQAPTRVTFIPEASRAAEDHRHLIRLGFSTRTFRFFAWFLRTIIFPISATTTALYGLLLYLLKNAELLEAQRHRPEADAPPAKEDAKSLEGEVAFSTHARAFTSDVELLAASALGHVVAAVGLQNEVTIWRTSATGRRSHVSIDLAGALARSASSSSASPVITAIAVDEPGTLCAVGTGEGVVAVFQVLQGAVRRRRMSVSGNAIDVQVRAHERLVLETLDVDTAYEKIACASAGHSRLAPIGVLASILAKERVKAHLAAAFVRAVLGPDDAKEDDTHELRRTVDACRSLGGEMRALGDLLERVVEGDGEGVCEESLRWTGSGSGAGDVEKDIRTFLSAIARYRRIAALGTAARSDEYELRKALGDGRKHLANVCLEGSDQHRGWLQSQLLMRIATIKDGRCAAPYKTLITHGMVLDQHGKTMSKSLGNMISPLSIVLGGKHKKAEPACGADTLRLWAAIVEYWHDMSIDPVVLSQTEETMRRIRNSVHIILSNIGPAEHRANSAVEPKFTLLDRYVLQQLEQYTLFNFPRVIHALNHLGGALANHVRPPDSMYVEA